MVKVIGVLTLGKDAELKEDPSWGSSLISFSAVHSKKYTNKKGEKVENSIWVNCEYWVKNTAILPYLKKGAVVYVEGEPKVNGWFNKGTEQVSTSLGCKIQSIDIVKFAEKKEAVHEGNALQQEPQEGRTFENAAEDDLPF